MQARIFDDDRRRDRKRLQDIAVLVGEFIGIDLVGEVQVSEDLGADLDRDAKERFHRRMVGREADRLGVVGDVSQPDRLGIVDQHAEDAFAAGEMVDVRADLGVDADGDELGEPFRSGFDHAERPEARPCHPARLLDDVAERDIEIEVALDDEDSFEELLEADRVADPPVGHDRIVPRRACRTLAWALRNVTAAAPRSHPRELRKLRHAVQEPHRSSHQYVL